MKLIIYSKDLVLIDRYKNLFTNYTYEILNDYEELCLKLKKENSVVLMNINECGNKIEEFLTPLVELNSFLMILDSIPEYEKGKRLVSAGVRAYGNLMIDDIHLKDAINNVMDGNIWLYPEFINETVSRMRYEANPNTIESKLNILSHREKEVALLVLKKQSYLEISEHLNITLRTVKAHTKNIYEKFNVSNRLSFILIFNY